MTHEERNSTLQGKDVGFDLLLTVPEVAQRLRLKQSTVRKMIFERRIDTVRPSQRSVRIPEMAVKKLLEKGFRKAVTISE